MVYAFRNESEKSLLNYFRWRKQGRANTRSLHLYPLNAALGHKGRKEVFLTKSITAEKNLHVVENWILFAPKWQKYLAKQC